MTTLQHSCRTTRGRLARRCTSQQEIGDLLFNRIPNQSHRTGECIPFSAFGGELFPPPRREPIAPSAFAFVRQFPGRPDPALGLQTVEGRVQRTCLDLKKVLRCSLEYV